MANILLTFGKDIEVAAEDVLHFVTGVETKVKSVEPTAVAALGVLLGAVNTALGDVAGAASANGLNVSLDATIVTDLKAAWSDVVAFAATLGIKL